jgi:hypothetical protein
MVVWVQEVMMGGAGGMRVDGGWDSVAGGGWGE